VNATVQYLNPAEAARRLGVSAKALRLYEQRGLVTPVRTSAGWRAYGPDEMVRAGEVASLRALGLSLTQVARVLASDPQGLAPALAAHQVRLEGQMKEIAATLAKVGGLRADLARGQIPSSAALADLVGSGPSLAFDLPWPWGGERFELSVLRPLTYITGPLGCGKTRLAKAIAETLAGASFLDLERAADGATAARARMAADPELEARTEEVTAWLVEDGAQTSDALVALLVGLETDGPLVVDMVEQGLDEATQEAVIAHLRRRAPGAPPLFLMTRSCAILDLAALGPDETVLFCPANHSPPMVVAPYPGAPGYEALASCLATPEVRARTEGIVAVRPMVA
jgi:DNA-binding transcriptional MerR regulator